MHRREWMQSGLGIAGALVLGGRARGDEPQDDSDPAPLLKKLGPMMAKIAITTAEIATGLHLIQGPGGNILVLAGPDDSIVVDAGVPVRGQEIYETVRRVGGKPVSLLINTHWHFDHAGGNEAFGKAGVKILATPITRNRLSEDQYTEVFKMTTPASPAVARPTICAEDATLHVGDETLHLAAVPPAHTDGDLIVHFTARDVIHTGDLFNNGLYPNIDASSRGWIGGMIAAADRVLKMAGPKTKIVPGHGPIGTADDLAAYRKMLVTVNDRLAPMVDAGKTIEQAIAARPTTDLDAAWAKGFLTGGMFTRIAYAGLLNHRAEKRG
jgi:cyclase